MNNHISTDIGQLIYTSIASKSFTHDDLNRILHSSNINNPKHCITGALFFYNKSFIQYIEGSTEAINQLFQILIHDQRHESVEIRYYSETDIRLFSKWSMAFATAEQIQSMMPINPKTFKFQQFTSSQAVLFFEEFSHLLFQKELKA